MFVFTNKWITFISTVVCIIGCTSVGHSKDHLSKSLTTKNLREDPDYKDGHGFDLFHKLHKRIPPREKRESRFIRGVSSFCSYTCQTDGLPTCHCDAACRFFNDCCWPSEDKEMINKTLLDNMYGEDMVCQGPSKFGSFKFPFGVWMKKNCSKKVGESVFTKCLGSAGNVTDDSLEIIPVTDKNGISYPNIYCAICNGAGKASPWTLRAIYKDIKRLQSKKTLPEVLQLLRQKTVLHPQPSKFIKPRICVNKKEQTANRSATNKLCFRYQQPVYFDKTIIRNIHCIDKESGTCSTSQVRHEYTCTPKCLKPSSQTYSEYSSQNSHNPAVTIELGPRFRLEYDTINCMTRDVLSNSEVRCIRFGCLGDLNVSGANGPCNTYHLVYERLFVEFVWFIRGDTAAVREALRRYVTVIYYVLLLNGIGSISDYAAMMTPDKISCNLTCFNLNLQIKRNTNWVEYLKIQNWVNSIQFLYTEITAFRSKSFRRVFEQSLSPGCTLNATKYRRAGKFGFSNDLKEMYQSLARYGSSFLLMENCRKIYLNVSVQEQLNEHGQMKLNYRPLQFYCSNDFPQLRIQLRILGACITMIILKLF